MPSPPCLKWSDRRAAIFNCPTYLLAGADDDITTPEQVLDATKYIGAFSSKMVQRTVPGGHIGLFMGARTLRDHWRQIASWIAAQ